MTIPALSCLPSPSAGLASMCRTIPGDAPLFTLFRVDASSIRWEKCEVILSSQLIFVASDARYRVPNISHIILAGGCVSHRCHLWRAAPWTPGQWHVGIFFENIVCSAFRISLKYQACPTVPGTEMKGSGIIFLFSCVILLTVFLVVSCYIFAQTSNGNLHKPFSLRGFFKTYFDLFATSRLTQQHGQKFKTLKAFYLWCQLCWLDHQCPHVHTRLPSSDIIQRFTWLVFSKLG